MQNSRFARYVAGAFPFWVLRVFLYRLSFIAVIFALIGLFSIAFGFISAGRSLHNAMLVRLMRAPMSYFDTTPLGRIVNRFSKDIDTVDSAIPMLLRFVLNAFFQCLVFVLLVSKSNSVEGASHSDVTQTDRGGRAVDVTLRYSPKQNGHWELQ